MRIDLPQCNLKTCRHYFDGNCMDRNKHEICKYSLLKNQIQEISNAVEIKMTYMCGCRNCIERVVAIINNDILPNKNYCEDCEMECDQRGRN